MTNSADLFERRRELGLSTSRPTAAPTRPLRLPAPARTSRLSSRIRRLTGRFSRHLTSRARAAIHDCPDQPGPGRVVMTWNRARRDQWTRSSERTGGRSAWNPPCRISRDREQVRKAVTKSRDFRLSRPPPPRTTRSCSLTCVSRNDDRVLVGVACRREVTRCTSDDGRTTKVTRAGGRPGRVVRPRGSC